MARLYEYQIAKDLFDAEHYALGHAFSELRDFVRSKGLKEDVEVENQRGTFQVPIVDGNSGQTRMFKHNLTRALALLLKVKQELDQMKAYRYTLPDHAWVIQDRFDQARAIYAELSMGILLI
jgi:hypothetical protein